MDGQHAMCTKKLSDMGLLQRLREFARDRKGVAAVEFAFIVPVLLCMYFITLEAAQAINVNRKVSRISSTVADLITQQSAVQAKTVVDIMEIGKAIVRPYNRSIPVIEVTGIQMDDKSPPVAKVAWSVKLDKNGNPTKVVAKDTVLTDKDLTNIRLANAFYIKVRAHLDYTPIIAWGNTKNGNTNSLGLLSAFTKISMGETFYLRPRVSSTDIKCSDCS